MKHTITDLAQMQALPLEAKIRMTKERITDWYNTYDGMVYVSFSGGKDSTVLKHIVDSIYNDVPALFVNTGLEYPELQSFVFDIKAGKYPCFNTDVVIIRPEKRFDNVIEEYGYPVISKEIAHKMHDHYTSHKKGKTSYVDKQLDGTYVTKNGKTNGMSITRWKCLIDTPRDFLISHKCCDIMKKKPAKKYAKETNRKAILGTLASESQLRKQKWLQNGCNAYENIVPTSQPLSFWTDNDILEYIIKYNVPYASVYGEILETGKEIDRVISKVKEYKTTGCDRTGCMFCMFGCHLKGDERFVKMKQTHPKQYEYCMKDKDAGGLGLRHVIEWLNKYAGTNIKI